MPRHFNVGGPCDQRRHYLVPIHQRLPDVMQLIDGGAYFVMHAPRQVGKTTSLLMLGKELTASGRYAAILLSVQPGSAFRDSVDRAELAILEQWKYDARFFLPEPLRPPAWPEAAPGGRIGAALSAWTDVCPLPLVVFLDEIDALEGETLRSVLTQLRAGHPRRPVGFPWSLALVGMRDIRDYKLAAGGSPQLSSHSTSPFNIISESLTLRNFSREEVEGLYLQHTHDTGQVFSPGVVDRVFKLTGGQPWLVNALGRQMVEVLVPQPELPVELSHVDRAKELLILRRDTHIDSLAERLREQRVRRIIEPMLVGEIPGELPDDDRRFILDLGLLTIGPGGALEVANPIYKEIIPRLLADAVQFSIGPLQPTWLNPDGTLNPDRLLEAFLAFWRQHGEALLKATPYHEAAPHLVMMAFLHRVVNGGGSIDREYAIGSGRLDLFVRYRDAKLPIELKVWRPGQRDPLKEGLEQLDRYLEALGLSRGWLVIFDRRKDDASHVRRARAKEMKTPGQREAVVIRA